MTIDEIKRQMFIDSEEVCGNTMIDTYQAQEYVEQAYNKAIDDFAEKLHHEEFDNAYGVHIVLTPQQVDELAKQLKAGGTE